MVTLESPPKQKKEVKPKPKKGLKWLILPLLAAFLWAAYEKFDDFVIKKNGHYEIKQQRKQQIDKQVKRLESGAELYKLVARSDGVYACLHCERGVFFLFKNETAKIGTTVQGEGRYKPEYLARMNLDFIVLYKGDIKEVLKLEKLEIMGYAISPENLARPNKPVGGVPRYRLARPCLNLADQ